MGSLDDPALGCAPVAFCDGLFSALLDVGLVLSRGDGLHGGLTFVARVGAQVLQRILGWRGSRHDDPIKRRF